MEFKFERLEVWQHALDYLDLAYQIAGQLPNRLLKKAHLRRWRARAALRRTASVRLAPRIARRLASGPF
jgi:hypothetical protein